MRAVSKQMLASMWHPAAAGWSRRRRDSRCLSSCYQSPVSGFTLVELLLVLFIISTFTALVTPSIAQATRRNNIDTYAEKLKETFEFAYVSAVSRRQLVLVNVDHANRRCWVTQASPSLPWLESSNQLSAQKRNPPVLAMMTWPEKTRLNLLREENLAFVGSQAEAVETISFRSNGRTDDVVVELSDDSDQRRYIEVVGMTGEVRMRSLAQ